jgi:hypothetical protein
MNLAILLAGESMSYLTGAPLKGYIKNNDTGETKNFQFNPIPFEYSRGVNYSEIIAPGQQYPITQFVSGQSRVFTIKLYLYDRLPGNSGYIVEFMQFVGRFLPPEKNTVSYKKPPEMTFVYGYFIRKCVLDSLDINIIDFDKDGQPLEAEYTLHLRQVSP